MNPFQFLFDNLVYLPQLNLLQLYYLVTKDIGLAIVLVAISVNLLLWRFMVDSYLSGIKMRILQPQVQKIQAKYKIDTKNDKPEELLEKSKKAREAVGTLYKKHGVKTSILFKVIFLQIFFASGVFYVVRNLGDSLNSGQALQGIYKFIFGVSEASFPRLAFWNTIDISSLSTNYLWLPIISMIVSYLYGRYSFHWAPNAKYDLTNGGGVNVAADKNTENKDKKESENELGLDPKMIERNNQIAIIYIVPIATFLFNANVSTGLNLYFATLSVFNLIRQIAITQLYNHNVSQLVKDLSESDPSVHEQENEVVDVAILSEQGQISADKNVNIIAKKKNKKKDKNKANN
jgi:YidC/Oxa1 family membrane protein insertase